MLNFMLKDIFLETSGDSIHVSWKRQKKDWDPDGASLISYVKNTKQPEEDASVASLNETDISLRGKISTCLNGRPQTWEETLRKMNDWKAELMKRHSDAAIQLIIEEGKYTDHVPQMESINADDRGESVMGRKVEFVKSITEQEARLSDALDAVVAFDAAKTFFQKVPN